MKVDSLKDIANVENFRIPFEAIPLAYYSKEETKGGESNYDKALVIFEDKGLLYIAASDGSKSKIPFNILTTLRYINQSGTEQKTE